MEGAGEAVGEAEDEGGGEGHLQGTLTTSIALKPSTLPYQGLSKTYLASSASTFN